MENKGLSLVIPFYNTKHEVLQRCLRSLAVSLENATMQFKIEVILVNDGSDNDYSGLIVEYKQILNLQYISLPDNCGRSNARNTGISNASYDIISFLDADDIVCSGYFETLNKHLFSALRDDIFVTFSYYINNIPVLRVRNPITGTNALYSKFHFFCTDTIFIPRKMLDKFRFDESLSAGEDIKLWTSLIDSYNGEHFNIPIATYIYDYKSYNNSLPSYIQSILAIAKKLKYFGRFFLPSLFFRSPLRSRI